VVPTLGVIMMEAESYLLDLLASMQGLAVV